MLDKHLLSVRELSHKGKATPPSLRQEQTMTPTGLALKVTNKDGRESFPCYEAFGWDRVNQIIANTLEIEHVLKVEIVDINVLR
jgi:hypothetical protein